jgi:cytidylate kinase
MPKSKSDYSQIAIDGPVAAGKGTVSRLVADRLDFLYVDTGAMYRMAALIGIRHKVDLSQEKKIAPLVSKAKMEMSNPTEEQQDGRLTTVFLNGEDVSWKIRTEEVSQGASKVAVHPQVREALVKKQQEIAQKHNVIMEGRDITYKVLPNANLKIYLTANQIVRAKRRHFELLSKGVSVEFEQVYEDLVERDKRDKNRSVDPLQIVPEAWVIDTSDLSIEKVVKLIVAKAKIMLQEKNE